MKYQPMWAQARALPPLPDDADECDICGEPCEGRFCSRECEVIAYPEDEAPGARFDTVEEMEGIK